MPILNYKGEDGQFHSLGGLLKGDPGNAGVVVGDTEPTDPSVKVWINSAGDPMTAEQIPVSSTDDSSVATALGNKVPSSRTINGKPLNSDVVLSASDLEGAAADSNKLGGKDPKYYIQPRNLLDNSDFTNPVNQRGQTGYSGSVYTIDRWSLWSANSNATLSTDGNIVAINPNGDDKVALTQRFAKGYLSEEKSYTFAYLDTQGTIHIDNNPVKYVVEAYDYVEIKRDALTGIIWAALYEGAYTADSLPPYVPKGYAAELAECQRYHVPVIDTWLTGFFKRGQGIVVEIPAARNIRSSAPTVVLNNPKIYTDSGWNDLTFAGVSVNRGYAVNVVFESAAPLSYGQAYLINGIESINMDL